MDLIRTGSQTLSESDRTRVAVGINEILVELGHVQETVGDWWSTVTFRALDDRTPAQAWLDGDRDQVRDLIKSMFDATQSARDRMAQDPFFVDLIARHQQTIR